MKKNLFLVLILSSFASISFPDTAGDGPKHVIFGGTTGSRIFVRDYQILSSGRWDLVRDLVFDAKGPVGTIAGTRPNDENQFSLYYTYEQNQQILGRNVRIDFTNFQIKKDVALSGTYGSFSFGTWRIQAELKNRGRLSSVETDSDVVTQKTADASGKPGAKKKEIFNNDNAFVPVSTSFDWNGTHTAQVLLETTSGDFFAVFRSLSRRGKPNNDIKGFSFNSDVGNISVGVRYTHPNGLNTYTVATRDFKLEGQTFKTSLGLNLFNADEHSPLSNRLVYNYKNLGSANLFNAAVLNTTYIYDVVDRDQPQNSWSYLIYGFPKGGKLLTYAQQFNPFTLAKVRNQVLVGANDPILQNADHVYGLYAVGFTDYSQNKAGTSKK
jgi:hypothetical protein